MPDAFSENEILESIEKTQFLLIFKMVSFYCDQEHSPKITQSELAHFRFW